MGNGVNKETGLTDCGCNAGFEPGIVLDPFMGSGTTAKEALKQGKRYLGIDLKQEYIDMANKRIKKVEPVLF
jgi:DNA modification methylase